MRPPAHCPQCGSQRVLQYPASDQSLTIATAQGAPIVKPLLSAEEPPYYCLDCAWMSD